MNSSFFIGWDVGAWVTARGDALWIVNDQDRTVGHWCGNLGHDLQAARSLNHFADAVFMCCGAARPTTGHHITLAVDAPFAFPSGLVDLLQGNAAPEHLNSALGNPYLFRGTERFAAEYLERNPLSALQDRIGSQTTKFIHFLTKLRLKHNQHGVWQPEQGANFFNVIETYPAMSKLPENLIRPGMVNEAYLKHSAEALDAGTDEKDALLCALIARFHSTKPGMLFPPPSKGTGSEGWIWFPKMVPDSASSKPKAEAAAQRILRTVVTALRQVEDTLSGDDSGLVNAWEEICVQVQYEHSYCWDLYEEMIQVQVAYEVAELSLRLKEALWLQTEAGWGWEIDEPDNLDVPVYEADIVEYLTTQYVLTAADTWSNDRIRRYLDRTGEFD